MKRDETFLLNIRMKNEPVSYKVRPGLKTIFESTQTHWYKGFAICQIPEGNFARSVRLFNSLFRCILSQSSRLILTFGSKIFITFKNNFRPDSKSILGFKRLQNTTSLAQSVTNCPPFHAFSKYHCFLGQSEISGCSEKVTLLAWNASASETVGLNGSTMFFLVAPHWIGIRVPFPKSLDSKFL